MAPGTRVLVRGEEWIVDTCLPVPTGGYAVHVSGLTELVAHQKAIFLTKLDKVDPLRPEDTKLVPDMSAEYRQTRLFLETLRRRTPPTDSKIHIGHRAAMNVMPFQLRPAREALQSLRPRILIADGVGLGKTIEVGILLSELIKRGRGRRILVVAGKSMLAQFQEELWSRFTIPLVRLDSVGIARVQRHIPSNRNPFTYFDRVIISIDTLKNDRLYRARLEQTRWDAVVVDECHNVANRGSDRAKLARLLAATADSLILTSATPHNGRPESFAHLMQMLDPTAVADPHNFAYEDVKHLFVRRFKKHIEAEASQAFSDREIHRHECPASPEEEAALAALRTFTAHTLGKRRQSNDQLFRWVLIKAFLSSPQACMQTVEARIRRIDKEIANDHPFAETLATDAVQLRELKGLVEACLDSSSKLKALLSQLEELGFDGSAKSPRVIIFSERIRTLEMLRDAVHRHFKMKPDGKHNSTVQLFHAGMADKAQTDLVESFGKEDSDVRLLLASDAASEGVNLHYFCNQLFHYDIPWSLIRLDQRMGRIDRFGQHKTPHLHYLLTRSSERTADQLIIDRLIEKEEQVHKQLGEAGVVLGLYDAEKEEEYVTESLAQGISPDEIVNTRAPEVPDGEPAPEFDLLSLLAEGDVDSGQRSEPLSEAIAQSSSLYSDDFDFAVGALRQMKEETDFAWESKPEHKAIEIWPPESFTRWRQPFLPKEAVPTGSDPYKLIADTDVIFKSMAKAREKTGQWSAWQLLWEQHPIFQWMLDSLAASFGRNQAPCIETSALATGRALYLFQAILSNQAGQPVLTDWFAIPVELQAGGGSHFGEPIPLAEALKTSGLMDRLANLGRQPAALTHLESLMSEAVAEARKHVLASYQEQLSGMRKNVRKAARRIEAWKTSSLAALEQKSKRSAANGKVKPVVSKKFQSRQREIERIGKDNQAWLDSLVNQGDPYIRVCAVLSGTK